MMCIGLAVVESWLNMVLVLRDILSRMRNRRGLCWKWLKNEVVLLEYINVLLKNFFCLKVSTSIMNDGINVLEWEIYVISLWTDLFNIVH
jgi:hypothetical protein